ncbi:MAG: GTP-binding protein [Candidatus Marsarchaeota archaeon]|jgi:translation elongation factor EF-1alpha|nr:GTP-binding protein [Candidatus Marsarchaeota archaeon]
MEIINVAFLGNKDHGKSTLIGNMLMHSGSASQARINEAKKYSRRLHRGFEPGFILDSFAEERREGMTYDTTRGEMEYKGSAFALIDVPGHEELIKNMISGASYANFAVLLVSAKKGEGVTRQTKRHLFLARMMGIEKAIIAVNKMDTVAYRKERFEEIIRNIRPFLEGMGFEDGDLFFIPISAYYADNLLSHSKNMKWYTGRSLFESMRLLGRRRSTADADRLPLRVAVQSVLNDDSGSVVTGRVISGRLRLGEQIKVLPQGSAGRIKRVFVGGKAVKASRAGENVALGIGNFEEIPRGSVIAGKHDNLVAVDRINALIFFSRKPEKSITINFCGVELGASLAILNNIDVTTGKRIAGKCIKPLGAADVLLRTSKKIPAEPFGKNHELGRFTVYSKGLFIGIGIVK